ncbi:MAG: protein kinase [Verrucomicrobiota bacterium]
MDNKIFLGKYRIVGERDGASPETRRDVGGVTYEAEEIATGKKVAVELSPAGSLRPAVRTELEAEALAGQQLNHINIPTLYDFGIADDQLVYVTEYFQGTTAEAWVTAHGPMPIDAALRIALQIVGALGDAAFHKIFHHALSPQNVMIIPGQTAEGDWPLVKVIHLLGVAPAFAATDASTARFDNSALFASPEQLEHGTVDFRSEIFSLGCILWSLITGAAPFGVPGEETEAAPVRTSLAVKELRGVPKSVRRLLGQMLATNPEFRPFDPLALEEQIRFCLSEIEPDQAIIPSAVPEILAQGVIEMPIRRRFPTRALALAAIVLAIAAVAVMALPERFRPSRLMQASSRPAPIGIPIGIPEPSVAPVDTDIGTVAELNKSQTKTGNSTDAEAEANNAIIRPAATAPPAVASANQIAATPIPSESLSPSVNVPPAQRPVPLVASEVPATAAERTEPAPPSEGPGPVATVTTESSPGPAGADEAGATHLPAPLPDPPASAVAAEDPGNRAATDSTLPSPPAVASSSPEHRKLIPGVAARAGAKIGSVARSKGNVTGKIRFVLDEPKREGARSRLPRGVKRARFVGTTPDGRWMLELPSNRIVVVPPPPGF